MPGTVRRRGGPRDVRASLYGQPPAYMGGDARRSHTRDGGRRARLCATALSPYMGDTRSRVSPFHDYTAAGLSPYRSSTWCAVRQSRPRAARTPQSLMAANRQGLGQSPLSLTGTTDEHRGTATRRRSLNVEVIALESSIGALAPGGGTAAERSSDDPLAASIVLSGTCLASASYWLPTMAHRDAPGPLAVGRGCQLSSRVLTARVARTRTSDDGDRTPLGHCRCRGAVRGRCSRRPNVSRSPFCSGRAVPG